MNRFYQPRPHIKKLAIVFVLIASIGGIAWVAHAAPNTFSSFETNSATISAPATSVSDTSASGGSAVKFAPAAAQPACTNPVFSTSDPNGGWSTGGYYVHNNMWNWQGNDAETLYACSFSNWYVDATIYNNAGEVKTYPNVHKDLPNAFTTGVPYNNYSTISSAFAGSGPGNGIYNIAYDIWMNGVGWGNGTTEVMIWTENVNQRPLGSIKSNVTSSGMTWDIWHYNAGGANVVSFAARSTMPSGTLNLKEMINTAISRGYIPANPSINQIGYGVEICSTDGQQRRFTFTNFSLTMN